MEDALAHPYLEAYVRFSFPFFQIVFFKKRFPQQQHDPDDEPVAPPLDPEFFEFDRMFLLLYYLFELISPDLFLFSVYLSSQG